MELLTDLMRREYESPFARTIEMCAAGILCESPRPGESEDTSEEIWPNILMLL